MLGKVINKILHEDKKVLIISFLIFGLTAGVRLYFLFVIENPQNSHPGWYEDTYHHWQIAYLALKIGFGKSFLRLWDLKGMEYFWGLLHPLVLAVLMWLTGSSSIVIARLLSLFCGSLNIVLVWLLVKRYFGWQAGFAAALIAIFNPVAIYSDVSGMQEPLGILMFLTGMVFWDKKPVFAGIFWMLAGMVRAEYWLLGLGLMLVVSISKIKLEKKVLAWLGYGILALMYMKYLLDKTGNAIYPMYWNFMGNMKGEWQADILPNDTQYMVQKIYIAILIAVAIFGLWLLKRRPRYLPFFSLGLGNWMLLGLTIGLSKYLLSYLPRFWVDRIMILPYIYLAIWFSVLIFKVFGKKWLSIAGWLLILVVIILSQFSWQPIWYWRQITKGQWESKQALAEAVGEYYQGGKVLFFENHPASTYWLVYKMGIKAENIAGQMFDPYFYMEGDPYENWGDNREIVLKWLKDENIKLIAFFSDKERYMELVKRESDKFEKLAFDTRWNLYVYKVKELN